MRSSLKHSHAAVSFLFHSKVHIQFSPCATNRFLVSDNQQEPKKNVYRCAVHHNQSVEMDAQHMHSHVLQFQQALSGHIASYRFKTFILLKKTSANMNSHIQSFLLPHLGPGSPENNLVGTHFSEHKNQILICNDVTSNWIIAALINTES